MCWRQGEGECGRHHTVEHFVRNTDFEVVVLDKLSYASKGYDRLRDSGVFHLIQTYCVDLASALPPGLVRLEAETRILVLQLALERDTYSTVLDRLPLYSAVLRCTRAPSYSRGALNALHDTVLPAGCWRIRHVGWCTSWSQTAWR